MALFKKGDRVEWCSQSAGSITVKHGVVVATAADYQADGASTPLGYARKHFPGHRHMFDGHRMPDNGVLVEVRRYRSRATQAKPLLYKPHPGKLTIRDHDEEG